ncbi:MAG TPA: nucleoside hydrolase [Streptosporangiaceae bacterium]
MKKILLDCDTGIDDAMLLLYLASAIKAGEAELVAAGTVHGNIDAPTGALNTLRVLELTGVEGVPVAVGAARPLAQGVHYALDVHGTDGLGEIHLPVPKALPLADVSAPEQIVRLARRHPGELTLLAVGPLTNLAVALLLEPRLPELVHELVVMGGAFDHPGNITTHAEANVWHDPEAADLVFAADWPLVLVPLDATHPTAVDGAWLDRLSAGGEIARLASKILDFYVAVYTPILGYRGCVIHDPLAAMIAVDPSHGVYTERPIQVELRGEHTRGTTLWDARTVPGDVARRPVKVLVESDVKAFKDRLLAAALSH